MMAGEWVVKRPEEKESHWSRVRKGESREFGKGVQVYIQQCNIDVRERQNPLQRIFGIKFVH